MHRSTHIFALGLMLVLTACATTTPENPDPWEKYNRGVHSFNETVDTYFLKPVAQGYVAIMPKFAERGVSNFFDNLLYPRTIVNQFLQGKFRDGATGTGRFIFNSTIGLAGFIDVATEMGIPEHKEDFGQTLAVWGVDSGPYTVLPFFGPSTLRDGFAKIPDHFMSPITYIENDAPRFALQGLSVIDTRAGLLAQEEIISGDKYLFMRDAYLQRRAYMINDAQPEESDPFLDNE